MTRQSRSSALLLALAGLLSALFTIFIPPIKATVGQFSVGFYFGVVLAVYFVAYDGCRRPVKIAAFVFACTAAYKMAEFCAMRLYLFFPTHESMSSRQLNIPLPIVFLAGCVGAFAVFGAGVFAFGPRNLSANSLPVVLLGSAGGGLLGIAGHLADVVRPAAYGNEPVLLFLVWQPAIAALLSPLLAWERRSLASSSTLKSATAETQFDRPRWESVFLAGAFFTIILVFFGVIITEIITAERRSSEISDARRRVLAQAPPLAGLPPLETMSPRQTLILERIAGFDPSDPASRSSGHRPDSPSTEQYSLNYTATSDTGSQSLPDSINVNLTQFPSPDWALYHIKYPDPNSIDSRESVAKILVAGQAVLQERNSAFTCFRWPSGNFEVSICSRTSAVREEFFQKHLTKYPSSL